MFKIIFEYAKSSLTYRDILKISHKINLQGNEQFKEYFSSVFFEEPYSHSSTCLFI
jgi:hypothetical protein